ncbi:MAG: 50S ribosomal protein L29 [Bacteroidales bacterium 45-6]|nr:MAG: 50S ribosomal protein L29 [Bacteroidales bacterium 45-6]
MKAKEVRELSDKELVEKIANETLALDQLILNHAVSPLDNPAQIKAKRKDIARFKTVLRQRELNK